MFLTVNADKLQTQRERAQMTPYRLAKEAGLPVNAIYRLENGTTKMTNHLRAREIAEALQCGLRIFLPKRKEPKP